MAKSLLEHPLVVLADRIAEDAHGSIGQKRKWSDDPYIVHPRRVAAMVAELDGATVIDVAAAKLHDVVEDVPLFTEDVVEDHLIAGGATHDQARDIVFRVMELTKPYRSEEGMSRAEKRAQDWAKLATVSQAAKRIKLIDRIDNLSGYMPRGMALKYIPESRELVKLIGDADPALAERLTAIIDRLDAELSKPRE